MKNCPFCAEEIQDEAIKCKHCDSNLLAPSLPTLKKQPSKNTIWLIISGACILVVAAFVYFSMEKSVTQAAMDKYGYTADRYSFRLVSLSPSNATLKVTALDENYSWTLKFSKNVNVDGTWDRDFDQMAADSKELDEIEVVLKGMMSGMIHEGYVYYNKEEGNKYRELVKKYNLKHPSSPLKAS